MGLSFTGKKRIRKSFGVIPENVPMPNLIEVQKSSYDQFLMKDIPAAERGDEGLQAVFKSVFPIKDFSEKSVLDFVSYEFEPPKFDVDECGQRDLTYAAPLKVKMRLVVFDVDEETGARSVKDIKEQDVYMGDIPLMTDRAPLSSTARNASSFRRCTVRRACFLITTGARPMRPANSCLRPALFPIADPGSISSLMPRTWFTCVWTAAGSFRSPRLCMRWVWTVKKFSQLSMTVSP